MKSKDDLTTDEKLKELLTQLNQTMIADQIGCRTETINRWCRGKRKISKVYARLINALHEDRFYEIVTTNKAQVRKS